jgi:hypothetical protein
VAFPSCSRMIASSGKEHEHLHAHNVTIARVRKELGEPTYSRKIAPSSPISKTTEYIAYSKKAGGSFGLPSIGFGNQDAHNIAALCEVYTRQGPFSSPQRGRFYAEQASYSGGFTEFDNIPKAIRKRLSGETSSITFWYDPQMHVTGVFQGDIREAGSDWW